MSVFEAISLMISFTRLIVTLIFNLDKLQRK